MSSELDHRLRVLGSHLDDELRAAARHTSTIQVVPTRHTPRLRNLATVAAVAVMAFGLGVALTLRGTQAAPAGSPTEPAPSLFDGGVDMIVFVDNQATDTQIAFLRDAISSQPDLIDTHRIEYVGLEASTAEARRVVTDPPALEQLLPALPTMFKLFATPTADLSALRDLAVHFERLPMVLDARTALDEQIAACTVEASSQLSPTTEESLGPPDTAAVP